MVMLVVTASSTRPIRLRTAPYNATSASPNRAGPVTVPPGRTKSVRYGMRRRIVPAPTLSTVTP